MNCPEAAQADAERYGRIAALARAGGRTETMAEGCFTRGPSHLLGGVAMLDERRDDITLAAMLVHLTHHLRAGPELWRCAPGLNALLEEELAAHVAALQLEAALASQPSPQLESYLMREPGTRSEWLRAQLRESQTLADYERRCREELAHQRW